MMLSSSSDSESSNSKILLKSTAIDGGLSNKPFSATLGSFISSLSFSIVS